VFKDIVLETVPKQIAKRIKQAIVEGKLQVKERLPTEDELAVEFGVSRPTIREALKRLASENLIEAKRGAAGGNFVKMPSDDDIRGNVATSLQVAAALGGFTFEDVIASRLQFQALCCRMAAKHRTDEDIAALRKEIEVQRNLDLDDVGFCASDVRFHCRLAEASHNQIVATCLSGIVQGLQPALNLMLFRFRDRKVIIQQHAEIVDCIEHQDENGAVAVIEKQIRYLQKMRKDAVAWRNR
jgi:GntR family transcriptional regulator, transcriptional repressor for pyruvate dehydrogenase complex